MAAPTRPWTRADLERLPDDGNRYEVLDGVLLVTPQPAFHHQLIATRMGVLLHTHCDRHRLGSVVGPGAIPRGESELQPDLLVVPGTAPAKDVKWADLPNPSLVVEVLSPSTRRRDLFLKRAAYLRWGITEYWVVDPDRPDVTVVRAGQDDERVVDTLRWRPSPDHPALEIDLVALFR